MMKLAILAVLSASASAFAPLVTHKSSTALYENKADLEALAKTSNPAIGFWDPWGLADQEFWGETNDATIGWIRESELKHGRIAMFAFVGYCVHANGITWPWNMQLDGTPFPKVASAPEAWDAISEEARLQIILFIGFLEYWNEACRGPGNHYMRNGRPGDFPDFDASIIPGGALNLFDPTGNSKKLTAEQKQKGLIKELNNGRLAMIGIFGFLAEGKIEGSVPLLKGVIPHYDGDVMAPLANSVFLKIPDLF